MKAPSDIGGLYIKDCEKVALATRCYSDRRYPSYLRIFNVKYLNITRLRHEPMIPDVVHLENITYIDVIPQHTFAQVDKGQWVISGCTTEGTQMSSLTMKNVNIGEIQSGAILATSKFKNATFTNVTIRKLQTDGIRLKLDVPGEFRFENSSIDHVEHLGFQLINTHRVIFSGNRFTELAASAINGTFNEFYFVNNTTERTQQ
ncbi:hypothetical protein GWI33_000749 [Rhynchophorus ferrugineus]|uniref:Right handed beta helix domain-containing protein n=1 Tax=Rhynchophorus ferrugineus TaxID=354439 RepID=A0A834HLS5_RHYFE|nr:hypothetical protein GWI33_000749 [Rhynchophorus ferrugineus]